MRHLMKTAMFALAAATLTACGGGGVSKLERAPKSSSITGRKYEDQFVTDNGLKYKGQDVGPGLVFIEGGTFHMGGGEKDIAHENNNRVRQVSVTSFYLDETEVKNVDWKEFLTNLGNAQQQQELYPDTTVWYRELAYNEPYIMYYYQHPGFLMYPVVGVDWYQVQEFCKWRTNAVNEDLKADDPEAVLYPAYRLPTEAEWEYAARAGYEQENYPWEGKSLRYADSRFTGNFQANFKRGRGDYAGRSNKGGSTLVEGLNDAYMIPAPVKAFLPNEFGLYDMAGNVAEWTLDTYRVLAYEDVEDLNPYRRRGRVGDPMQWDDSYGSASGNKNDGVKPGRLSLLYSTNVAKHGYNVFDPAGFDESYDKWDNFKVYRGGSWADVAYYLTCGSRRFYYADSASSSIGFRCAMTRVGSPKEKY
jgi:sulfatase modifying factor 1